MSPFSGPLGNDHLEGGGGEDALRQCEGYGLTGDGVEPRPAPVDPPTSEVRFEEIGDVRAWQPADPREDPH